MIIQELSYEIIEAMRQIDANAQIAMLKTIDQEKPMLVVTHIHQGTQADEIEWPVGEMIVTANDKEVYTLDELQAVLDKSKGSAALLECRDGRIGYFKLD